MARTEVHTGEMKTREVPTIVLSDEGPIEREPETIVLVDKPMETDYMKELAFNEEILTIRLERTNDKYQPARLDFYVQGRAEWVPVGRPWKVARKYVEVIARSQPYDVRTTVTKHEDHEENRVERHTIAKHPFSVIHDPNPRGMDWLQRIMLES